MSKQNYYKVTNPLGQDRIILAIDANAAIQFAVEKDKFFWSNTEYKAIKSKI